MPPPPLHRQWPPFNETSVSQPNSLGIRIVPYSPPPPDHRSDPTSRNSSSQLSPGRGEDPDSLADNEGRYRHGASNHLGSTPFPSPPALFTPSTTARGIAVSDSATPFQRSATPSNDTHSYSPDNSNINAKSRPSQEDGQFCTSPSSPNQRPWSRRRNIISLHSDKTFSLHPHQDDRDRDRDRGGYSRSPRLSYSTTSVVSDLFTDDQPPSSPLTTLLEHDRSISPGCTLTPVPVSTPTPTTIPAHALVPAGPDSAKSSPWNYRIVGGLRKVPQTPDLKSTPFASSYSSPTASEQAEESNSLPAVLLAQNSDSSLRSIHTPSTASDTTNYKVYESTSPYEPTVHIPSSPPDEQNYRIVGQSPSPSVFTVEPPTSPESSDNYVVHGRSSPLSSSPVRAIRRGIRQEYSQESLVVPPLQPHRRVSSERLQPYKPTSRESLRRASSLKSISSIFSQETPHSVLLAGPATAYLQFRPQAFSSIIQDRRLKSTHGLITATAHMNSHPHQWSSQLSTVASESEGDSELASRSLSLISHGTRRSSGVLPSHNRNLLSISSSPDKRSLSHSRPSSDSVDQPQATLRRPSQREVKDLDEHGDGLTDLRALNSRPSRNHLSGFFPVPFDRNLSSSSSSRANSLTSLSLPSWTRLYYGSGERKLLTYSSQSTLSETTESRRASLFGGCSPPAEHSPSWLHNQRQRPKASKSKTARISSRQPLSESEVVHDRHAGGFLRRQTSSLWSPHLRQDHRASRYSVWDSPTGTWSGEGPLLGQRNVQVALFVVGFILPFAWMIGACLPLPKSRQPDLEEVSSSMSQLGARSSHPRPSMVPWDAYHEGARWWRRLNRFMSIVGLFVIGAVIALVVVGVRQRWGS